MVDRGDRTVVTPRTPRNFRPRGWPRRPRGSTGRGLFVVAPEGYSAFWERSRWAAVQAENNGERNADRERHDQYPQLFYLFNCRRIVDPAFDRDFFDNHAIFIACGVLILLQALFTYLPYMNLWFGSVPLAAEYWIFPIAGGIAVFLLVELEKDRKSVV